jgi:hypothetical protein
MAKKAQKLTPLTMTEIILRGDAETIRQALEARTQIDTLLEEREAAYQRIAELETQVCEIVGEDGVFPFPEPPMPVATFTASAAPKKKAAPAPKPESKAETPPEVPVSKESAKKEAPSDDNADAPKPDDA